MIKETKAMVSVPKTKAELIEKLQGTYQQLIEELNGISEEESRVQELKGKISICDLLAYQIGWGKLFLGWELAEKKGESVIMPAEGYKWNQLGALAVSFYKTYQHLSLAQLRLEFEILVEKIKTVIHEMHEEELYLLKQRRWAGEKWPIAKWIQVNTIAPYSSARQKIRQWKKSFQA